MEPDDLMPSDNTFFFANEPVDQVVGRKKEKAQTLEAINVLKDIITRLDDRIAFYNSVNAIPDELKADPTKFMNMHNANQQTRNSLISERDYIRSLLETHAPNI